jgi:DNA mismatch repair protein MutL
MGAINLLPETIIDKIAAGEVVERPASVVKELIENSLDAGAHKLAIDLADAGKKLIRVSDDGDGIAAEDLALAVSRHATSKLSTAEDLFNISTLGFRGEALAAIASVSDLGIKSRRRDSLEGAELRVSGKGTGEVKACGMPEGTVVEVDNLFMNVPARRKFLKFARTELSHVLGMVHRFALAFPEVHFAVTHNGRTVMNLPPARTARERVRALFGAELAECLLEIPQESNGLATGLVTPASFTRANTRLQYFFLNKRFIRDRVLARAVSQGYRTLIPQGRFPAYFLFMEIPPGEVDVNVHPTKLEVRFRHQARVFDAVQGAVRRQLAGGSIGGTATEPSADEIADELVRRLSSKPVQKTMEAKPEEVPVVHARPSPAAPAREERFFQVLDSYLVSEGPEGVLIIDQHALHERIIFEELKSQAASSTLAAQSFLIPEPIELLPEEVVRLGHAREKLEELGVKLERLSRRTVVVRSLPQIVAGADPGELLEGVLERLEEVHSGGSDAALPLESILEAMACRAAIKAGEKLSAEEMWSLLRRARETRFQATCPHGRPTTLIIGRRELEKRFRRT